MSSQTQADDGTSLAADLAPVGDLATSVQSPRVGGAGLWRAGISAVYQREPFVVLHENQVRDRIVRDQIFLHAQASLALFHRLLVALDAPMTLVESGEPPLGSFALRPRAASGGRLGDVSLSGRVRLAGAIGDGEQIALAAKLWIPTGADESYAGGDAFRGRLFVIGGGTRGAFSWSSEAGVLLRESRTFDSLLPMRTGSSITAGASVGYAVDPQGWSYVGPEIAARSVFAGGGTLLDARSSSLDLLLTTKFRPAGGAVILGVAGGPGIGQAVGTADYRIAASIAWSPERAPPPSDRDDDAVPDSADVCPDLPGVRSADPVMNGCPELPPDRDGDSIPDAFDACREEPGEQTGDRRTHGCPFAPDTDGDGEDDRADACPDEPGLRAGDPARNGCPRPKAELVQERIVISEQVRFESGTAVLRAESGALLQAVARVLEAHPDIALVEVHGHTDDTGSREVNLGLSLERARAVVEWLVAHGVATSRLKALGFGADRPLSENATEAGRSRNRRVEFVVKVPSTKGGGEP